MKIKKIEKIHYDEPIPVYDVLDAKPAHNFVVATNSGGIVAHNCAFIDEINFAKSGVKDIQKAKRRIKELYDVVVARVEGTFRLEGVVWGKIFAVSSKKSDQDFLEERVNTQLAAGNEHLLVFDEPQWEILPEGTFSPERFYIAIGDKHKKGFVVENDSPEALHDLEVQGYKLLQVPLDMKTNFISDFDVALRDLAGISVPGALSFITQSSLDACIGSRSNPFYQNILEIGTKDSFTIEEFFHVDEIPQNIRSADWFIHLDLSLNDDKTGIGASCITGRKDVTQADGKTVMSLPFISHVFSVSIKAPTGDKIPYSKILNFICWLRKQGFHIELITRDQFQSEYIAELLEAQGFKVEKISLDRTPDGYIALRSVLLEQRIDMLHNELLEKELILLQRDAFSGRIDHPVGGSKDSADGFAGSVWSAVKFSPGVPVNHTKLSKAISAANSVNRRGNDLGMMRNQPRQLSKGSTIFKNGRRR